MAYTSGLLKHRVTILNRKEAQQGKFGLDSAGVEFEPAGTVWASVEWAKGKGAMNAGALDAYTVMEVRTRWTDNITMRSRVKFDGNVYQIIPETFNANHYENTLQFLMQLIVNDK